ncbi:helix-turn-helix domain-containing protein [Bosea sp. 117]|uniref:winged helix-turn-helix transcriptional regulator n=1 Tax=Bosea sp. 117 TaxID=1125973 RepID=UPI0004949E8B|nr:helix-turn-helix domain-containing protein [Bosea sp. 117]
MEMAASYGQFCPVAMAAEIVCTRWTALVLRELLCGSRRFNDLRRGVPRMSPTLLSKRLKELAQAGVIEARRTTEGMEYQLTSAGEDLREVIMALGFWGQRWVETEDALEKLDPTLLMWDMRRNLDPKPIPEQRRTIRFHFPEVPASKQKYWLVVEGGGVDLCWADPGFDIDLYVRCSLRSMTAIWMGATTVRREMEENRLQLDGDETIAGSMQQWLGLSPFARPRSGAIERAA